MHEVAHHTTRLMRTEVNRLRRLMLAILVATPPSPHQDAAAYLRRPGRDAGVVAQKIGLCGDRQLQRGRDWLAHVELRPRGPSSALLLKWRGVEWLRHMRVATEEGPREVGPAPSGRQAMSRAGGRRRCWYVFGCNRAS